MSLLLELGALYMQSKAYEEQKKASRFEQAANDIRAQKERIQTIRQARIKRAQVASMAEATGTSASSGAAGAAASISSQVASGLSTNSSMQSLSQGYSQSQRKAASYLQKANIFQAGANLSTDIAKTMGGV